MRVASLHLFPVKSLRGVDVDAAVLERAGFAGDRRWMVVDPSGDVVTAREHPAMLGVRAVPVDGGVRLEAPGREPLVVDEPGPEVARVDVSLSRLPWVRSAGGAAAAWLSEALGRELRLVWLDDPARRPVSENHGGRPGDPLSLADAGPLLVTTTTSLVALNGWIADEHPDAGPLPMERFRPNVVVDGADEPWAEDGWGTVRVGEVELRFAEHCDRCSLTRIDLTTLRKGKEPVRTLARHRKQDGKVWFGVRMVPVTTGRIAVGDAVVAGAARLPVPAPAAGDGRVAFTG